MNLVDFRNFPLFEQLRKEMGAKYITFHNQLSFDHSDEEFLRLLEAKGIDVDLNEVEVGKDSTLIHKNQRVILYIRDWNTYGEYNSSPRFHIANCQTYKNMVKKGRSKRYVVAQRDDGKFRVIFHKSHGVEEDGEMKLDVCKNCLEVLGWKGYKSTLLQSEKDFICENFSLKEFFAHYPKSILSTRGHNQENLARENRYPENWDKISEEAKKRKGYQCESCSIGLRENKRFLHVHHIDGDKSNNFFSNLEVLCIRCHAKQPNHSHIKRLKEFKEFDEFLRKYKN